MRTLEIGPYWLNMERYDYIVWHRNDDPPYAEVYFGGASAPLVLRDQAYTDFSLRFHEDWEFHAQEVSVLLFWGEDNEIPIPVKIVGIGGLSE